MGVAVDRDNAEVTFHTWMHSNGSVTMSQDVNCDRNSIEMLNVQRPTFNGNGRKKYLPNSWSMGYLPPHLNVGG